ncbi:MAG TPA: DUF4337 domain-containing protein [Bryobacteraceae bacterium]|jgi:hypothetical protein|nr:DUF4337 domain-containing protein [Bryobacteraceae bacterium]
MSAHEEVEEHIQHAQNPFDKAVAGTMAIIAACLAIVSVLGQHFNTEKLLEQQKASDQWAYYQAKDIRRYTAQVAGDVLLQMKADPAAAKKYSSDASKYRQQTTDIQDQAREFERERDKMGRQADSFHLGEVFLEVAIVFSSLSILAKRKLLFYGGLISAVIGFIISISGYLLYGVFGKL